MYQCKDFNLVEKGILYFLVNFSKIFFSTKLSNSYLKMFDSIAFQLGLENNSEILSQIINFVFDIFQLSIENNKRIDLIFVNKKIMKIFQILNENLRISLITDQNEHILSIGKLPFTKEISNKVLQLHQKIFSLNPVQYSKLRRVYIYTVTKIIVLAKEKNNNYEILVEFYKSGILNLNQNSQPKIGIYGLINDMIGLVEAIKSNDDFNTFMQISEKVFPVINEAAITLMNSFKIFVSKDEFKIELNIVYMILKFYEILSDNKMGKIVMKSNNVYPDDIFKNVNELIFHFKIIYLRNNFKDNNTFDEYSTQIKPLCSLIQIYSNMFKGKYINFGTYMRISLTTIQDLFSTIFELIFSVRIDIIIQCLNKTKVFFSMLKILYCDFFDQIINHHVKYQDNILQLVLEGADSTDLGVMILSYEIISILNKHYFKFLNRKKNLMSNSNFCQNFSANLTISNSEECISQFYEKFSHNFQVLLKKTLEYLCKGEKINNYIGEALLGLILIYKNKYSEIVGSIVAHYDIILKEKIIGYFEKLIQGLSLYIDERNSNIFSKKTFGIFK